MLLFLRFLHIMSMAVWIGPAFFVGGDVKRSLASPDADLKLLVGRMNRYSRIGTWAGVVTILTGFGLIFAVGGFKAVPMPIHIAIIIAVAMMGVGGGVIDRNCRKIAQGVEAGASAESLVPHAKKIMMGVGIFHTLWMITVALMVFRHGLAI